MAKGVRFDHAFLAAQTEKRKKWKAKGKKAGHGGDFDIHSPLAELNRSSSSVLNPPAAQDLTVNALVDKTSLPEWAITILEKDSDIQYLVATKKTAVNSPHKMRIAQGIKKPDLFHNSRLAEHWVQVRIFYALEVGYSDHYPLTFAIPNGGYRTPKAAATMKYEGQKAGVPDIFFPIPRGKYHGFFLEVKTEKGSASKDQQRKLDDYRSMGYCVKVGKGVNECLSFIRAYLKLPEFDNKTAISG